MSCGFLMLSQPSQIHPAYSTWERRVVGEYLLCCKQHLGKGYNTIYYGVINHECIYVTKEIQ